VVVVLPLLPVPLQIICWTREVWNSPLFIAAREMEERGSGEMRELLLQQMLCALASSLGSLLLHSLFVWKSQVNLKGASVSISLRAGMGISSWRERREREQQQ
jgi:hypothetical protein